MNKLSVLQPSILLLVCLSAFPLLSETIYTPSLPNIAKHLNASMSMVEWTLSIYFIGYAFGICIWGRVSDTFGRRNATLVGLSIYGLACIFCMISNDIFTLYVSRFCLAFGASTGSIITQTIARDSFSGRKRHQVYTNIIMTMSIVPAIGSLIGGLIVHWWCWRTSFILLLILDLCLLCMAYFKLPEILKKNKEVTVTSWLQVLFKLVNDKRAIASALMVGCINTLSFSYYTEAPFIFITKLGLSSYQYGLLGCFITLAIIIGSSVSHMLNRSNLSLKNIILSGCFITLLSSALLVFMVFLKIPEKHFTALSIASLILPICGVFIGASIAIPNILSNALVGYTNALGTASSLFSFLYYMIMSAGVFFMGILHNGTLIPMPLYFLFISILLSITVLKCNIHFFNPRNER